MKWGCLLLLCCASARAAWTLESSHDAGGARSLVTHIEKVARGNRPVPLHLVLFDTKKCGVEVIDHPFVDGGDLSSAMRANHCLAGVNGNYFQPDRTPLGLVISNGQVIHPVQKARLLSGVLAATPNSLALLRTEEYRPGARITQALQAGPFLVDRGKAVAGLNSQRQAVRTVVLSNGRDLCALVVTGPATLAETAEMLATPDLFGEIKIARALNLDGGASSGLWISDEPKPYYIPEISAVRNYLGVVEHTHHTQ